jgi:Ca2+-binding EF-hand superfamily protein
MNVAWVALVALLGPLLAAGAFNSGDSMESLMASVEETVDALNANDTARPQTQEELSPSKWMEQQEHSLQIHKAWHDTPEFHMKPELVPMDTMDGTASSLVDPKVDSVLAPPLMEPDSPSVTGLEPIVPIEMRYSKPVKQHKDGEVSKLLGHGTGWTAALVDSVLLNKAEDVVSDAEQGDPLLADPLVSLEDEEEDETVRDDLEQIKAKRGVPRFDLKLFSDDTIRKMDVNNDGLLSYEELRDHLNMLIKKARTQELIEEKEENADGVKEIIESLDTNGDGLLSKSEIFSKTEQTAAQSKTDNRMFDFADANHDGKLNGDELFMMALPQVL